VNENSRVEKSAEGTPVVIEVRPPKPYLKPELLMSAIFEEDCESNASSRLFKSSSFMSVDLKQLSDSLLLAKRT
jgi:hypothetical protein